MKILLLSLLIIVSCSKKVNIPIPGLDRYYTTVWEENVDACNNLPGLVSYAGTDLNQNAILDVEEREYVEIKCQYLDTQVSNDCEHRDNANHYGCYKKERKHICHRNK